MGVGVGVGVGGGGRGLQPGGRGVWPAPALAATQGLRARPLGRACGGLEAAPEAVGERAGAGARGSALLCLRVTRDVPTEPDGRSEYYPKVIRWRLLFSFIREWVDE